MTVHKIFAGVPWRKVLMFLSTASFTFQFKDHRHSVTNLEHHRTQHVMTLNAHEIHSQTLTGRNVSISTQKTLLLLIVHKLF